MSFDLNKSGEQKFNINTFMNKIKEKVIIKNIRIFIIIKIFYLWLIYNQILKKSIISQLKVILLVLKACNWMIENMKKRYCIILIETLLVKYQ